VDFVAAGINLKNYRQPGFTEIQWTLNEIPIVRSVHKGPASTSEFANMEVGFPGSLYIGSDMVFAGHINDMTWKLLGGRTDQVRIDTNWHGWEQIATRRFGSPSGGGAGIDVDQVMDSIIFTLEDENISLGTVESGSTAATSDYTNMILADVLDDLAALIDGYWYIDPWPRVLHLREYGSPAASWALSTSEAVWNIAAREHRDEYVNWAFAETDNYDNYDDTQISGRVAVEGGTGYYQRIVGTTDEADKLITGYSEIGWEITYDTHKTDIRVGMGQTVNLESEFGLTNGTELIVTQVTAVEEPTTDDEWLFTVTLQNLPRLRGWQRQLEQAWMSGAWGTVRHYHP
jgi:hypothetical protein